MPGHKTTVGALVAAASERLTHANIPNPRLDSYLLLAAVLGQPGEWLRAHPEYMADEMIVQRYQQYIQQRLDGYSVASITGHKEFYGLDFQVTPEVLIPRAETEKIVELAIKYLPPNGQLIDIGTGCGAIAIAVKANRPDANVTATELSTSALTVARANATQHNLNVTFIEGDLFSSSAQQYDCITANLPYLSQDQASELLPEAQHEPAIALFGGSGDGLDLYRRFFALAPRHMHAESTLFVESDPWQHPELKRLAGSHRLSVIEEDYFVLGFKADWAEVRE